MTTTRWGWVLIVIGVLAWVAYAGAKLFASYEGPVTPFLLFHLLFVIPGAFLAGRGWTKRVMEMFSGGPRDDVSNG